MCINFVGSCTFCNDYEKYLQFAPLTRKLLQITLILGRKKKDKKLYS